MNRIQYYIVCGLGALCLVLAMVVLVLGKSSYALASRVQQQQNKVQIESQQRQEQINKGMLTQQLANNIVSDVASASIRNPKLAALLKRFGMTVTLKPNEDSGSQATQTPAAPREQP